MTSALFSSVKEAVFLGATSYAFCRGFNQSNPFEKAALATVLVGLRDLAGNAIGDLSDDKLQRQPLTNVLIASASLLAIPCTLYAGRVFNFKAVGYLQIVGLASLGYTVKRGLEDLYTMLFSKKPK